MQRSYPEITSILTSVLCRKGFALTCLLAGIALFTTQLDRPAISADYQDWVLKVAIGCLLGSGVIGLTGGLVTAEIKQPKCNYCSSNMITHSLVCPQCGSKSSKRDHMRRAVNKFLLQLLNAYDRLVISRLAVCRSFLSCLSVTAHTGPQTPCW